MLMYFHAFHPMNGTIESAAIEHSILYREKFRLRNMVNTFMTENNKLREAQIKLIKQVEDFGGEVPEYMKDLVATTSTEKAALKLTAPASNSTPDSSTTTSDSLDLDALFQEYPPFVSPTVPDMATISSTAPSSGGILNPNEVHSEPDGSSEVKRRRHLTLHVKKPSDASSVDSGCLTREQFDRVRSNVLVNAVNNRTLTEGLAGSPSSTDSDDDPLFSTWLGTNSQDPPRRQLHQNVDILLPEPSDLNTPATGPRPVEGPRMQGSPSPQLLALLSSYTDNQQHSPSFQYQPTAQNKIRINPTRSDAKRNEERTENIDQVEENSHNTVTDNTKNEILDGARSLQSPKQLHVKETQTGNKKKIQIDLMSIGEIKEFMQRDMLMFWFGIALQIQEILDAEFPGLIKSESDPALCRYITEGVKLAENIREKGQLDAGKCLNLVKQMANELSDPENLDLFRISSFVLKDAGSDRSVASSGNYETANEGSSLEILSKSPSADVVVNKGSCPTLVSKSPAIDHTSKKDSILIGLTVDDALTLRLSLDHLLKVLILNGRVSSGNSDPDLGMAADSTAADTRALAAKVTEERRYYRERFHEFREQVKFLTDELLNENSELITLKLEMQELRMQLVQERAVCAILRCRSSILRNRLPASDTCLDQLPSEASITSSTSEPFYFELVGKDDLSIEDINLDLDKVSNKDMESMCRGHLVLRPQQTPLFGSRDNALMSLSTGLALFIGKCFLHVALYYM